MLPPAVLFQSALGTNGDLRLVMRQPASGSVAVVVFRGGMPTMVFLPGDGRSLGDLMLGAGDIDVATLDALVQGRATASPSLERLLQEHTAVPAARVQRLLDFQARQRLLELLTWREGFFELQDYRGGGETAFHLDLPGLDALAYRAEARARALPALLDRLPAAPGNTLVRRRRGGTKPQDAIACDVHALLEEPLLVPQIVARLLLDDDLVIGALARLADAKSVVLQPRVALAPPLQTGTGFDPRLAGVVRDVLQRTRGSAPPHAAESLTAVILAGSPDAAGFVQRLAASEGGRAAQADPGASTGLTSRTLDLGDGVRLSLLAIQPQNLSRGALEGILSRFDALVLLRCSAEAAELERLQHLRAVVRAVCDREPLTVGVDLDSSLRVWTEFPDAVLGLPGWQERPAPWLVERLVDAVLAATAARQA